MLWVCACTPLWCDDARLTQLLTHKEYISPVQVTTGHVVGGKVVVEGIPLEGAVVTVLLRQPKEPFTLSAEDEDELLAAMAEIERGEFVSADDLLESLRKFAWRWRFASRSQPGLLRGYERRPNGTVPPKPARKSHTARYEKTRR